MAVVKINLLPPDVLAGGNLLRIVRIARIATFVLLSVFLVFGIFAVGFLVVSSMQLRDLTSREESLKNQIKELQVSEQKMVLLKDRIAKIKTAQSVEPLSADLDGLESVFLNLGSDSGISELAVDSQKTDLAIFFRSPNSLREFLTNLKEATFFKSIALTSFGFNPATGYSLSVRLTPK